MSDAVPSTDKPVVSDDGNTISFTDFTVENFKPHMKNLFYRLDGMANFYFVCDDKDNPQNLSQTALAMIFNALYAFANQNKIDAMKEDTEKAEETANFALKNLSAAQVALAKSKNELSVLIDREKAFDQTSVDFTSPFNELISGGGQGGSR